MCPLLLFFIAACDQEPFTAPAESELLESGVVAEAESLAPLELAAGEDIALRGISDSEVELKWRHFGGSQKTEYRLQRKVDGVLKLVAKLPTGATSFTDKGLNANTAYSYRVRACDDRHCWEDTPVVTTKTLGEGETAGSGSGSAALAPLELEDGQKIALRGISDSAIELKWRHFGGSDKTEYRLQRKIDGVLKLVSKLPVSADSYVDEGLDANTAYSYRVRACDGKDCWDNTPVVTTRTLEAGEGGATEPTPESDEVPDESSEEEVVAEPVTGPLPSGTVAAFPGAQGFGAMALSRCDRSDIQVLPVTNLKDSGAGSLRAALAKTGGGRLSVIVFRVAGYLELDSRIEYSGNCVYIAGQTAPGEGVTVRGKGGGFLIRSEGTRPHDIVMRYLRFRGGYHGDKNGHIAINVASGDRMIFDHLSLSWMTDKMLMISRMPGSYSSPINAISVQRTLLGEPLAHTPVSMQIAGNPDKWVGSTPPGWMEVKNISVHHNLFASSHHRNPNVGALQVEVVNNVVHNWRMDAGQMTRATVVDWVNNYSKRGPMSTKWALPLNYRCDTGEPYDSWKPSIYTAGNVTAEKPYSTSNNWDGAERRLACYWDTAVPKVNSSFQRGSRIKTAQVPVKVETGAAAYGSVLEDVGSNRRLDCKGNWVSIADAVDRRLIQETQTGRGVSKPPETERAVGGYPSLNRGTTCADADSDGMPDEYEKRYGFNPNNAGDASRDNNGNGYANLEDYLNGVIPR